MMNVRDAEGQVLKLLPKEFTHPRLWRTVREACPTGVDMNANVWYASDVLGRKIRLKSDRYHDAIRLDINELSPGFWWIFAADFSGKLLLKN